jgi:hypothetical protein
MFMDDGSGLGAMFGETGAPLTGWRSDLSEACGRVNGPVFSSDGLVGFHYWFSADQQGFWRVPTAQVGSALLSSVTDFVWSGEFSQGPQSITFSQTLIGVDMSGRATVGSFDTGASAWVDALPGALQGQYTSVQVAGTGAFVSRLVDGRIEWLWYNGSSLTPFLGGPSETIADLVTDGAQIVWTRGSDPYVDAGVTFYATFDLYSAAFATTSTALQPK